MTKRLVAIGLIGVLVTVGALLALQSLTQPDLRWDPAPHGLRFLAELDQDYTFTKGLFRNESDRPIELRDVRVGSATPGLTLLGISVAANDDFLSIPLVFGPSFPPPQVSPSDVAPVAGYKVNPGATVRLMIGLRVSASGIQELKSIAFDYGPSVFGRTIEIPYVIRVCAPSADFWDDAENVVGCPIPDPPQQRQSATTAVSSGSVSRRP